MGGMIMNTLRSIWFFFAVLFLCLVTAACNTGASNNAILQTTIEAQQTQMAALQTQVWAEKATQEFEDAVKKIVNTDTPVPSPTPLPPTATDTPIPTETPTTTATPEPSPTATAVPPTSTSPPVESGSGDTSAAKGQERIRVVNNSGEDFSISLVCSGGPCQDFSNTSYKNKFPTGTFFFHVYPGRYDITWTICGETDSFVHALNGQWYIRLKKCK